MRIAHCQILANFKISPQNNIQSRLKKTNKKLWQRVINKTVVHHLRNSMKTNFEIEENYAVQLNGIHIDLHNNFEFKEISEFDNAVQIEFIKSIGDWVNKNEFEKLTFLHKNVTFKNLTNGDSSEFPEDEDTLNGISFFPKSMREINDEFMEHTKPTENDDIIYLFENGKMFRLNCDEIELIAEK